MCRLNLNVHIYKYVDSERQNVDLRQIEAKSEKYRIALD